MREPTIEIVPVGDVAANILQQLPQKIAERFPGRQIGIATQGLAYPDYAFAPRRKQYQAGPILEQLSRFGPHAQRILGVADLDLFTPGLNFIFGQAQAGGPTALIALARLHPAFWGHPPNQQRFQERTINHTVPFALVITKFDVALTPPSTSVASGGETNVIVNVTTATNYGLPSSANVDCGAGL